MHIVIDIRTATPHFPGIGRYVANLTGALGPGRARLHASLLGAGPPGPGPSSRPLFVDSL